ncbi:peptidoglycan peptidase [Pseudogemmobacter faecipullorum]|uniref:Peptidoglycan peptidase n=1 Tax=Pseudogemmobacter faecipullorum TaxID=2755041 RepID=A0ABS8CMD4_9RHOB|nr:peptidoglycan peptidase [Pseudogemmobacter faecipullorum]MCB5410030.1 peptidoglycan peptidase [Pseudogemmobacter faecipullorum]
MKHTILAASATFVLNVPAWAQDEDTMAGPEPGQPDYSAVMTEAAWDWRPGDLIFRNGINEADEAVKRTFSLRWATVGILRPSSGGPRVVFVDHDNGVTEEMLYAFVDGLSGDDYAAYRPGQLDPDYNPETDVMTAGPMAKFALLIAYGAPQDNQFLFGNGAFYGAELAYEAALNAGIVLGSPARLGVLLNGPQDLEPELRQLLAAHRYCEYETSFDSCWETQIANLSIVTTDSLIASGALERVFP